MGLNRRTFLQKAGLALFSLGVSETTISLLGNSERLTPWLKPYLQTLAATTNRKLAFLIGINQYSQNTSLNGCVTDVELQKELLIHRFGFNQQDILTLTDLQATRENIEAAFLDHLVEQVRDNDVVVFHFSGYGSQVKIPSTTAQVSQELDSIAYDLADGLVPVDGTIPTKGEPASNELLKDTLVYLARSLPTRKLTMVLDTSFSPQPNSLQGNLKIRSYSQIGGSPSPEGLAFRERIKIRLASKGLKGGLRSLPDSEFILAAADTNQIAVEKKCDGFTAGLFTYALTQHLWQTTPSTKILTVFQGAGETVATMTDNQQQPVIDGSVNPKAFPYDIPLEGTASAEGFITEIDSKGGVNLKLTGIPITILDSYGVNSYFSVVNQSENSTERVFLQLLSRNGLEAKTELIKFQEYTPEIKVGQLVRESIRILSRKLGLIVGLNKLERIERVDATSALANIKTVGSVVLLGERSVDCLLSKVASKPPTESSTTTFNYGLSTLSGTLIPKTLGATNEAVKSAISRLEPQFSNLLGKKWLELTVNDTSSLIPVTVRLESSSSITQNTSRVSQGKETNIKSFTSDIPVLTPESKIKFSLTNNSDRTLYGMVLEVNSKNNIVAPYIPRNSATTDKTVTLEDIAIAPLSQVFIPQTEDSWEWEVNKSEGITQIYLLLAIKPFKHTLESISQLPLAKLPRPHILTISNPLDTVQALLQDLHETSAVPSSIMGFNADVYALDVKCWAGFKFLYQTVN